jgi:hypothetical protein
VAVDFTNGERRGLVPPLTFATFLVARVALEVRPGPELQAPGFAPEAYFWGEC